MRLKRVKLSKPMFLSIWKEALSVLREGGLLEHKIDQLEVECLPKNLPAAITVDVSNLAMGSSIHVRDITVPQGVKILDSEERTIVVVTAPKGAVATGEEAEATEE